jgi:hypothetical protein
VGTVTRQPNSASLCPTKQLCDYRFAESMFDQRRGSVAEVPGLQFRLFDQSRDVAQSGSALQWGCRGRGFKSRRPDWRGR